MTAQGRITLYTNHDRDTTVQVTAYHVIVHHDPNEESCHWLHTISLHRTAYDARRPTSVPQPAGANVAAAVASAAAAAADSSGGGGAAGAGAAGAAGGSAGSSLSTLGNDASQQRQLRARVAEAATLVASCGCTEVTVELFEDAFPDLTPDAIDELTEALVTNGKLFPGAWSVGRGGRPERRSYDVVLVACLPAVEAAVRSGRDTVVAVHDHLRSFVRFSNMQRADVLAALEKLVEQSVLYKVDRHRYSVVH
jgi:hypothetical protein